MTPEGKIEGYLEKKAKENKFLCYKFKSPGNRGVPDRVLIGHGKTFFVELKAPGEKPRPLQEEIFSRMRKAGATVFVADSKKEVDKIINYMKEQYYGH